MGGPPRNVDFKKVARSPHVNSTPPISPRIIFCSDSIVRSLSWVHASAFCSVSMALSVVRPRILRAQRIEVVRVVAARPALGAPSEIALLRFRIGACLEVATGRASVSLALASFVLHSLIDTTSLLRRDCLRHTVRRSHTGLPSTFVPASRSTT